MTVSSGGPPSRLAAALSFNLEWRHRNPGKAKACAKESRRRREGLPVPTRPEPDVCECCERPKKPLNLDHDHETGEFRGWLCNGCNTSLGHLGDNIAGVRKAFRYLLRAKRKTPT